MKVLLTGIDGYIGTILSQVLLEKEHDVIGLDTGYYRSGWLYNGLNTSTRTITKDIRSVSEQDLKGFDAVIHLAELSNDPLGQLNPKITNDVSHIGSFELARKAKNAGVKRFVYSSSCSVYGIAQEELVNEESGTNPQTEYAKCKLLVEQEVAKLADDTFSPVFLRNATVYGPSPRMRFDLVVNNLSGIAWTKGKIVLTSDGTPWRPLVHIRDASKAFASVLDAPKNIVHNQIFNVGSDINGNYQVKDIAAIIQDALPNCEVMLGNSDGDTRSYRVSFKKINTKLPGFFCSFDVKKGVKELITLYKHINLSEDVFSSKSYTRLKELQYLIKTNQLDENLFWRTI